MQSLKVLRQIWCTWNMQGKSTLYAVVHWWASGFLIQVRFNLLGTPVWWDHIVAQLGPKLNRGDSGRKQISFNQVVDSNYMLVRRAVDCVSLGDIQYSNDPLCSGQRPDLRRKSRWSLNEFQVTNFQVVIPIGYRIDWSNTSEHHVLLRLQVYMYDHIDQIVNSFSFVWSVNLCLTRTVCTEYWYWYYTVCLPL